jgi:hypothetical protein
MSERISDAISGTLVISKISERIRGSPKSSKNHLNFEKNSNKKREKSNMKKVT